VFAEFYSDNPLLLWPLVGLVIFVASFAAVLLYVAFGLRERSKVEYLSSLPLQKDAEVAFGDHGHQSVEKGSRDE